MHATNVISHLSHATNAINAISHAINAISDECDKSDTYHTCDITSLISHPHLLLGVRRIGNLNDAARATLAPLLGDNDAAVDSDGDRPQHDGRECRRAQGRCDSGRGCS